MSENFGPGVSRTLSALKRQYAQVVWLAGKPPLDSEINLISQIELNQIQQAIQSQMPSGFITDPTRPLEDYQFNPNWASYLVFGHPNSGSEEPPVWANVNGWLIPVTGTNTTVEGDLANIIKLYPPPSGPDTERVDFVFLEAWVCRINSNPSTVNKPSASTIWPYGNVLFGGAKLPDDIEDPAVGFQTTARVQVQYRIRVFGQGQGSGSSVDLYHYPDGLGDTHILGQGTATNPVSGFAFENMGQKLGDPSLWRAGNGDVNNGLGTIDGYTYAIPICAVFRRNWSPYESINTTTGTPNQNGAYYRLPTTLTSADPLSGARLLTTAKITLDLLPTAGITSSAIIHIDDLILSGFDEVTPTALTPFWMVLDNEIILISDINKTTSYITIPAGGRGRFGSAITKHNAETTLKFYNTRPDGLFADQIVSTDILDLRHAVNTQDWDYYRLLEHNVMDLVKNDLRSTWKASATGNTQGTLVHEVDVMDVFRVSPYSYNQTGLVDGPDGIRTIWSDAATIQPDVTMMLKPTGSGSIVDLQANIEWATAPGFLPWGFLNNTPNDLADTWTDGSVIFMAIGGSDGEEGARGTFKTADVEAVRFLLPPEYWKTMPGQGNPPANEFPISIRFEGARAFEGLPADIGTISGASTLLERHPGPMYPSPLFNFERPFIVLGAILNSNLQTTITVSASTITGLSTYDGVHEIEMGTNFDTDNVWYSKDDTTNNFQNDPLLVTQPLNHGMRTLYGMLTNNGADNTGASSELYLVLWGDTTSRNNNGVFKVVGAGLTAGYTTRPASTPTRLRVIPLYTEASGWTGFDNNTSQTLHIEGRAQYHNSYDASAGALTSRIDDLCIGLTDLLGTALANISDADGRANYPYPWDRKKLGHDTDYDLSMPYTQIDNYQVSSIPTNLILNMTLLYEPGRGGFARCPDNVVRFAMKGGVDASDGPYLRQSNATIDPTFATMTGMPTDETYWDPVHTQLWNRLPARGLSAPYATYYGGGVVGGTEQDREHEVFIDRGSKTVVFRPFRKRSMTLHGLTETYDGSTPDTCLLGQYTYPRHTAPSWYKDAAQIFTNGGTENGKRMAIAIPKEYMPRFGRQDIPYWKYENTESQNYFLSGINHLFCDNVDTNDHVFQIMGGERVDSGTGVKTLLFITQFGGTDYGFYTTITADTNVRPCYVARKSTDISTTANIYTKEVAAKFAAVRSSDLGVGLKGIQLPPYLGVARLLGVYEMADYIKQAGRTFTADRTVMESNSATNLLIEGSCQQTLFIMQGGARDLTYGEDGDASDGRDDHTYIVPSNVIDITRIPTYASGKTFETFQYVVETEVFGFARGFINKNNYVLIRYQDGVGTAQNDIPPLYDITQTKYWGLPVDGTTQNTFAIDGINMLFPAPARANTVMYSAYNRTPYQGDAYMTRGGGTISDYANRYGQIAIENQYYVETPIQQYNANGEFVPLVTTPTSFEVLASMDFYTTYGTGKIGGKLLDGTSLDVCYTEDVFDAALRRPVSSSSNPWRVLPRTFTAGQTQNNTDRASVVFSIEDYLALLAYEQGHSTSHTRLKFTLPTNVLVTLTDVLMKYGDADNTSENSWPLYWGYGANVETKEFTYQPSLYPEQTTIIDASSLTWGSDITTDDCFVVRFKDGTNDTDNKYLDAIPIVTGSTATLSLILRNTKTDTPFVYQTGQDVADPIYVQKQVNIEWIDDIAPGNFTTVTIPNADSTNGFKLGTNWDANNIVVRAKEAAAQNKPIPIVVNVDEVTGITLKLHSTGAPCDHSSMDIIVTALEQGTRPKITTVTFEISRISYQESITENLYRTMKKLAEKVNAHSLLKQWIHAEYEEEGVASVRFYSLSTGNVSEGITLEIEHLVPVPILPDDYYDKPDLPNILDYVSLKKYSTLNYPLGTNKTFKVTKTNFNPTYDTEHDANLSFLDSPINAGEGDNPISLTGITERFPLGILLQDSDFLCEDPLNDDVSGMKASPAVIQPIQSLLVPTQNAQNQTYISSTASGAEYTRFTGEAGILLTKAEGTSSPSIYQAWTSDTLLGTKTYRTFRGCSSFVLSGQNPGGPIDWVAGSFPAPLRPVLKGGVLACRALLVRNFIEDNGPQQTLLSAGDEIQMVIMSYGIIGNTDVRKTGLSMHGTVSPSGYGEGYAAVDRYRIGGHPMFRAFTRQVPNASDIQIAPYPETRI